MPSSDALPVNAMVGPDDEFVIEAELARGGFGITYKAYSDLDGRIVAIKEYFPNRYAYRAEDYSIRMKEPEAHQYIKFLGRFIEEAETLARFDHPNIVRVEQIVRQQYGTAYIIMEFIEGGTLQKFLEQTGRPPTQKELDAFLVPLIDALDLVHYNQLLHRDIAPKNILLRGDRSPVLIDFGSARPQDGDRMTNMVSPGYAPPEQYGTLADRQGPWSDIYSLAATLYAMIARRLPPEGCERPLNDTYVPLVQVAGEYGHYRRGFLEAIDWAMEWRHSSRPQSIQEWSQSLLPRPDTTEY